MTTHKPTLEGVFHVGRIIEFGLAMTEQDQLTRVEASVVLDVSVRTLERWAQAGIGPQPIKRGPRLVRYNAAEVRAFRAGQASTNERRTA